MERKIKRDYADKWFLRPEGIEAKLAHARRFITRRRKEKAEQTFQRIVLNTM